MSLQVRKIFQVWEKMKKKAWKFAHSYIENSLHNFFKYGM